jgi:hypothetical protein
MNKRERERERERKKEREREIKTVREIAKRERDILREKTEGER